MTEWGVRDDGSTRIILELLLQEINMVDRKLGEVRVWIQVTTPGDRKPSLLHCTIERPTSYGWLYAFSDMFTGNRIKKEVDTTKCDLIIGIIFIVWYLHGILLNINHL